MGKIKLIMVAVFIGMVSCTQETSIEEQLPTGETADLEIVIAPSEVMTKSNTIAPGYGWATEDELQINTCILAVFKKEANDVWKKVFLTLHTMEENDKTIVSDNDRRLAYKVSTVTLSVDSTYYIQVIANPSSDNIVKYQNCSSLTDFEKIEEGSASEYTFKASNLVKAGKKIVGKDANDVDKLNAISTRIVVPLTQLAARVDLNIQVKLGEKTWISSKYEKEDGSSLGGTMTEATLLTTFPTAIKVDAGINSANLYYMDRHVVFDKGPISESSNKGYKIPGYTAVRIDEYSSWTIDLTELTILNVRTQATAVLPMKDSDLSLNEYTFSSLNTPITFYTYGREFKALNPLQVSLNGTVYEANVKEKTKVECNWYAYVNKKTGKELENDLSSPTGDPVNVTGGWGGGEVIVFFVEDRSKDNGWIELPGEDVVVESTKIKVGPYDRVFSIEPTKADGAKTDGILDGNQYSISATITKMNVKPSLNYEVIPWSDNKQIDIPFN